MRYYEHWSPEHIKVLLMIAAVMACVLSYVALKASDKVTTVILRILAVSHLILEFAQDILLVTVEDYEISWILPLHLCNLGIFVNLIAAFSRGKARRIFSEISVMLIMPGALGALLFPDWNYRPIDDPVAIIIFITHTILLLIPIIFVMKGITDIRISHIWYPLVFMLIVVPPIYMFDTKFSVNYLFLKIPVESSPLSMVHDAVGADHYILGLFFLLVAVLLAEYIIAAVIRKLIPSRQR